MSITRSLGLTPAVLVIVTHIASADPFPIPSPEAGQCGLGIPAELANAPCTKVDFAQTGVAPFSKGDVEFILRIIGGLDGCDGTNPASCKQDGKANGFARR